MRIGVYVCHRGSDIAGMVDVFLQDHHPGAMNVMQKTELVTA
jgi:heterodisulfide reductase subunit A-like polyferredoxin